MIQRERTIEILLLVKKLVKILFPRVLTHISPTYPHNSFSFKFLYECLGGKLMIQRKRTIEISPIVRKCVKILFPRVLTHISPTYPHNSFSFKFLNECLGGELMIQKEKTIEI